MKKRILASLMAVCLIAGLLPTAALAAEPGTEQTALVAPGPEQESTGDPAGSRQEPIPPASENAVTQTEEEGDTKGTEENPYSLEDFSKMTRAEYIAAQERLDGTMYVDIDDYTYDKDGVLGNGTASNSDKDSSKLNYYGAPGAKSGEHSDAAVGKNVVFVGGTITSGVKGYKNIDQIDTSLLLAVPAYTNVTFQGITFNNVMRFNYQLYTSPWSQLGELKFDHCTFNGIIVGATAAQTLTFDGCEFTNYTNGTDENNSNPIWIRPAYGNWNAGDNEGQGDDFRSLTEINFTNNKVTSTRPVKFEFISQWDKTSTVTAKNNYFDISRQNGDTSTKNVGLYLGAHKDDNEFNLIVENNSKSDATAALYTIPAGEKSLPAGSTVKDSEGNEVTITDALEWKTNDKVELKTEYQDSAVAGINGVSYNSLDEAINAAKNGDTITILKKAADENGYKLNGGLTYSDKAITIKAASGVDVKFDMSSPVALHGAKITFEGVTFEYKPNNNFVGLQHTDTMVYNKCVFNGQMFLYGASETFNDCTFRQDADAYNVWTYGAKKVEFNGCEFNCAGKSVLVYNEGTNPGTDLTVTDTAFHASQRVEGKAAIEIDTSLMKGQTKITVDQATADKITGFDVGSVSGSSLWNDKKNNAQSENITVTVSGKVVLEPQVIDFDAFIKRVEASKYTFDGTLANGKKLTVKWSPVSGCFDLSGGHHQLGEDCPEIAATGNTPNRLQDPYAQYQLFASATDLSISNVNFVYVPKEVSVCMNGSWGGKNVTPTLAELQLNNSGDTSFAGCTFDKVTVSPYGKGNNNGNTNEQNIASFTGCEFANVTDKYAIKDVYAGNVTVKNCTFNNCGGGIYLEGVAKKGTIDISDNNFTNIGAKGLIQFSASGDYTNADIILDGNTATNCGPILRQLNQGIADKDVLKDNLTGDLTGLGGKLTYTSDSVTKKTDGSEPAQPTVYTVKFENADVADMKVIEGTKITLPTPENRPNYTFEGWYVGNSKVSSPFEVTGDVTLVAQWRYIDQGSSSDPTYSVSTPSKTENGTVTVSPKSASKGDTVTITVDPDEGYVLDELTVTDSKGEKVELTKVSDTKYTFTMPRSRVTIEATFVEDPDYVEPDPSTSVADIFDDIQPGAWYEDAVQFAYDEGIMTGTSKTTFEPNTTTTRGMIVSILHRLEGNPVVTEEAFSDVSADDWYGKAVAWASSEGIVGGYGDGTFQPNKAITREEMASILYRYAQYKDQDVSARADLTKYTDADQVGAWAEEVMQWANAEGLINGMTEDTLVPQGNATRAQVAAMFQRYLNK